MALSKRDGHSPFYTFWILTVFSVQIRTPALNFLPIILQLPFLSTEIDFFLCLITRNWPTVRLRCCLLCFLSPDSSKICGGLHCSTRNSLHFAYNGHTHIRIRMCCALVRRCNDCNLCIGHLFSIPILTKIAIRCGSAMP